MFELCIDTDVFYCGGEALYHAEFQNKTPESFILNYALSVLYCLKPGSCELLFCLSEFNHQLIIALIQIFHSPDEALIITVINLVMPSLTLVKCLLKLHRLLRYCRFVSILIDNQSFLISTHTHTRYFHPSISLMKTICWPEELYRRRRNMRGSDDKWEKTWRGRGGDTVRGGGVEEEERTLLLLLLLLSDCFLSLTHERKSFWP